MSGTPTESEIQAQWKNSISILEQTRAHADTNLAGAGAAFDTLIQSLEGEYTPDALSGAAAQYRAGISDLIAPGRARDFLDPIIYEYAAHILTDGAGYLDIPSLWVALYEHFHANGLSVKTRNITYGTPANDGGNVGNGTLYRLTEDENGYDLEACHAEVKRFRCRSDQNSGASKHAEQWEVLGSAPSQDSLLLASYGSGTGSQTTLRSLHAGSGDGGSLLRNSSFSSYDATATPKFDSWAEDSGSAQIGQDTTNFYRSYPNASVDGSMKFTGYAGDIEVSQDLASMRGSSLDPDTPYFLRVMLNADIGSASTGSVVLTMGSVTKTVTIASLLGGGWVSVMIPADQTTWFRSFDVQDFKIKIKWDAGGGTSTGYLLMDDMIFRPYDLIDGTYWALVGGTIPWLVDDKIVATDTGGAPATAKLQWWNFISGLGYLPSAASPTMTDPT